MVIAAVSLPGRKKGQSDWKVRIARELRRASPESRTTPKRGHKFRLKRGAELNSGQSFQAMKRDAPSGPRQPRLSASHH